MKLCNGLQSRKIQVEKESKDFEIEFLHNLIGVLPPICACYSHYDSQSTFLPVIISKQKYCICLVQGSILSVFNVIYFSNSDCIHKAEFIKIPFVKLIPAYCLVSASHAYLASSWLAVILNIIPTQCLQLLVNDHINIEYGYTLVFI